MPRSEVVTTMAGREPNVVPSYERAPLRYVQVFSHFQACSIVPAAAWVLRSARWPRGPCQVLSECRFHRPGSSVATGSPTRAACTVTLPVRSLPAPDWLLQESRTVALAASSVTMRSRRPGLIALIMPCRPLDPPLSKTSSALSNMPMTTV